MLPHTRNTNFPPKPGSHCWVSTGLKMRQLPPDLAEYTEMIWHGRLPEDTHQSIVERVTDGKIYHLQHIFCDWPYEWKIDGQWLPETDPRVHQALRDYIEQLKMEADYLTKDATIESLEWTITRSGGIL